MAHNRDNRDVDVESVWVGNVPDGYSDRDVRAELERHNIPCPPTIKVCQSAQNNQYAFLKYGCRWKAETVLMGTSAIVWKKTKIKAFLKVFFFYGRLWVLMIPRWRWAS